MYELSNKSIVISPRKSSSQKFKSIIPAFILTLAGTFAVWAYEKIIYSSKSISNSIADSSEAVMLKSAEIAPATMDYSTNYLMTPHPTPIWAWFLAGALLMILILSIINWKKL